MLLPKYAKLCMYLYTFLWSVATPRKTDFFQNILDDTSLIISTFHSPTFLINYVELLYIDLRHHHWFCSRRNLGRKRQKRRGQGFLFSARGHLTCRATGNRFLCHSYDTTGTGSTHQCIWACWLVDSLISQPRTQLWSLLNPLENMGIDVPLTCHAGRAKARWPGGAGSRHRPWSIKNCSELSISLWSGKSNTSRIPWKMLHKVTSIFTTPWLDYMANYSAWLWCFAVAQSCGTSPSCGRSLLGVFIGLDFIGLCTSLAVPRNVKPEMVTDRKRIWGSNGSELGFCFRHTTRKKCSIGKLNAKPQIDQLKYRKLIF